MAIQKVIPALVAGCAVVLKPAELTSLTPLRLGELAIDAGVPPGVLNIVTGTGARAGEALVRHPDVLKITFTGSTAVGIRIGQWAMQSMTRLTLELGGKSPMIVLPDCDIDRAAQGVIDGIFANAGQACCAAWRLYAHSAVFDALLERVAARAGALQIGPGLDSRTDLAREEIFGPVLVAAPFESDEEAIRLANDTRYGLAASVWSNDPKRVRTFIESVRAGTVWVNAHNPVDPALPFGGYGLSGFGREGGPEQLDSYLETKAVWVASCWAWRE